jgi:hypothetical protein
MCNISSSACFVLKDGLHTHRVLQSSITPPKFDYPAFYLKSEKLLYPSNRLFPNRLSRDFEQRIRQGWRNRWDTRFTHTAGGLVGIDQMHMDLRGFVQA